MCWNNHHRMTFPSKNFRDISIKLEISAVIHFNVSLLTNKQPSSDRHAANCGSVGITSYLQPYIAGYILNRTCKLTVIHSLVTGSLLYIPQDFSLFVIIFLTSNTISRHGSTGTSDQCDSIRMDHNDVRIIQCDSIRMDPHDVRFIRCAPGWNPAATQTPARTPQHCNCSHHKYGQRHTFKKKCVKPHAVIIGSSMESDVTSSISI